MLKIKLLSETLKPKFGSSGAAGMDLRIDRDVVLSEGQVITAGTGIQVAIPDGFFMMIVPRSSSKFRLYNTVGIIDSDYRGEIKLMLQGTSREPVLLNRGDRVVQAILCPVVEMKHIYVNELDKTARGESGFGSTGTD